MYDDDEILGALTRFMEHQCSEENILFLQAVHRLNDSLRAYDLLIATQQMGPHQVDHKAVELEIQSIFTTFIAESAENQINLSFECSQRLKMALEHHAASELTLCGKRAIFEGAVNEIERLMMTSVLPLFYFSPDFQCIAEQRGNHHIVSAVDDDDDDDDGEQKKESVPRLTASHSFPCKGAPYVTLLQSTTLLSVDDGGGRDTDDDHDAVDDDGAETADDDDDPFPFHAFEASLDDIKCEWI